MRILYDGYAFRMQAAGGVMRYFSNLISRLPPDFAPSLTVLEAGGVLWPRHPALKVLRFRAYRPRTLTNLLKTPYYEFVRGRNFDIIHPTWLSFLPREAIRARRTPIVITVYDMIHERYPQWLDPDGAEAARKKQAVHAASAILCISEHTKNDLLEHYPAAANKVSVTYLAADLDATMAVGPEPVPQRPYFLYVGSRSRYKNFEGLLQAFARAATVHPAAALCVVGAPFDADELKLIADLKLSDAVEHFGHAADAHLAKLYRHSLGFVYPSFYEGFGIPPLEAMQCGTAVVASNRTSIPEVVGDAGLLFDPQNNEELTAHLLALLENPALRDELAERGRQRAARFSWDKTVAETIEVYRSVAHASTGARAGRKP